MALRRPNLFKIAAVTAAFVTTLLVLALVNRSAPLPAPSAEAGLAGESTEQRIRTLEAAVREHPERTATHALLAEAYVQRSRETGDTGYQNRAEQLLRQALAQDPRDAAALTGLGTLAAARHDFNAALDYGLRARRLAPLVVRPYGVVVDSLIELGRYEAAGRVLQRMIDLKPNLASYARVSYYRELHGSLEGALEAMSLAVSAGGDAPEQVAYVQTLLGDLQLGRGEPERASDAYRLALSRLPDYVDARFGLARAEARAGDFQTALLRLRAVVADRPDADHLALLGEVERRLGRRADAQRHLRRALAREAASLRGGANPDAGAVLLEASHGNRTRALRLGRRVWRDAPSVTSADALGWALTRVGRPREGLRYARRALRLGTRSATFHHHAGVAALAAGERRLARRHLVRALEIDPAFSPLEAPRARHALRRLSGR